ncbi:MAG: glycosyltransferase family 39 protein, partial [Gloeobacteraceae cyanobacterium ES-bin-316]|nr:glycosyltransferase family 39 protein [Ferruginibacter sp.]
GGLFALILGATCISCSVILRLNILYQPNSLDVLLWTTVYFTIVKYISTNNAKWLYFLALAFALGFLNKYNIAFLLLGLLPALLVTEHRKLFVNKHLYGALLFGLLLVLPNLIWQYNNAFPVFHHLEELAKTQLENVSRLDFLKEQLLFFVGSLFVLVAAFFSFFTYPAFRKYNVLFWAFLFTLLIFIYFKAKGYYAIGLYPIFMAFGAAYLEQLLKRKWLFYLRPVAVLLPILFLIPFLNVAFPISSPATIQQNIHAYKDLGLLRWEDGKDHSLPQDFADMLGWKELAQKVDSAYFKINDAEHTLVLCDNYGQSGAINYYSTIKNIQAVSFNADYINWFPLNKKIKHAILVKDIYDDEKDRKKQRTQFEIVEKSGEIADSFAREFGTTIYILKNARIDINQVLRKEIEEEKRF